MELKQWIPGAVFESHIFNQSFERKRQLPDCYTLNHHDIWFCYN